MQKNAVGALRAASAGLPDDPSLTAIVGELTLKSATFARLWARHDVRPKKAGSKRFRHPGVGTLELEYTSFSVTGTAQQSMLVYHADPASSQGQALALLRVLAADLERAQPEGETPALGELGCERPDRS